jgi:hypothetical protein
LAAAGLTSPVAALFTLENTLSGADTRKAAIDCTGYRAEMDKAIDLVIAGFFETDAVCALIAVQQAQEALWREWRDKYGLAPEPSCATRDALTPP